MCRRRPYAGGAEVGLQVARVVPRQGRHPVARLHAEARQGVGQPRGALVGLRTACGGGIQPSAPADDSGAAEEHARALQQVGQRQREVHHASGQHREASWGAGHTHRARRGGTDDTGTTRVRSRANLRPVVAPALSPRPTARADLERQGGRFMTLRSDVLSCRAKEHSRRSVRRTCLGGCSPALSVDAPAG